MTCSNIFWIFVGLLEEDTTRLLCALTLFRSGSLPYEGGGSPSMLTPGEGPSVPATSLTEHRFPLSGTPPEKIIQQLRVFCRLVLQIKGWSCRKCTGVKHLKRFLKKTNTLEENICVKTEEKRGGRRLQWFEHATAARFPSTFSDHFKVCLYIFYGPELCWWTHPVGWRR